MRQAACGIGHNAQGKRLVVRRIGAEGVKESCKAPSDAPSALNKNSLGPPPAVILSVRQLADVSKGAAG